MIMESVDRNILMNSKCFNSLIDMLVESGGNKMENIDLSSFPIRG